MSMSNGDAARLAREYVESEIQNLDEQYGDLSEHVSEEYGPHGEHDLVLVNEYVTDWRIRLQSFIEETGTV